MGDLGIDKIGEKLKNIMDDIKKSDARIRALESRFTVGTDPAISTAGFSNAHAPRGVFPYYVNASWPSACLAEGKEVTDISYWGGVQVDGSYEGNISLKSPTSKGLPSAGSVVYGYVNGLGASNSRYTMLTRPMNIRVSASTCTTTPFPITAFGFDEINRIKFLCAHGVTWMDTVSVPPSWMFADMGCLQPEEALLETQIEIADSVAVSAQEMTFHTQKLTFKCGRLISVAGGSFSITLPCCFLGEDANFTACDTIHSSWLGSQCAQCDGPICDYQIACDGCDPDTCDPLPCDTDDTCNNGGYCDPCDGPVYDLCVPCDGNGACDLGPGVCDVGDPCAFTPDVICDPPDTCTEEE